MRVCLLSREYPPDTGFGGIATFAKHLSLGLKDLGHDVEVVSLATGEPKSIMQDGILVHRVKGIGITDGFNLLSAYMPYSKYVLGSSTALWKKFLELHQERPFDVVDTPELLAEGLMPAVTKAVPLLIRLYTPHSKFIAEGLHNVTPSFDHQFVALLERLAMVSADVITSPSDDLAKFVSDDLNYPLEDIEIVRNPVDADMFSPDGRLALARGERLKVLFVGRLEERKGIRYLINAIPRVVKEFPLVEFVVIGDDTNNATGQRSVLSELKETIKFYGLESYIRFINRIPLSELPNYYRSADICIVPSVYDNSPYTCLEAMSCGRAVIGTSAGGTQEYIVDGESGIIIPPKDVDAITSSLLQLLTDDEERRRLGRNARQRVLERFQRTEIARQTAKLYELAGQRFAKRHMYSIYLKDDKKAFGDARELLFSYENMLHNELYRWSYRYRMRHWYNQITKRPRLSAAKVSLRSAKMMLKMAGFGRPGRDFPKFVHTLEEQVRIKSRPLIQVEPQDGAVVQKSVEIAGTVKR